MESAYYHNKDHLESEDFPFHIERHRLTRGQYSPVHAHEFIELVYIAGGKGEHLYNGHSRTLSKGDVFIIAKDTEHAYDLSGSDSLQLCNLLFLKQLLHAELEAMSLVTPFVNFFYVEPFLRVNEAFQPYLSLPPPACAEMEFLLERIENEYVRKKVGYRFYIKALLMELFLFLSRCNLTRQMDSLSLQDDEETIRQACDFIKAHCDRNIGLKQMSQMCGFSETKFSAVFKRVSGKTFIQFRNHCRIEWAKEMLLQTPDKIVAIAYQAGFHDLSMFNRTFKQMAGCSPRQFRHRAGSHPDEST